jgi:dihydroneopterin aldolase
MVFYGYHGVLQAEQEIGQRFMVDVALFLDLQAAGKADDLRLTINYAEVFASIKHLVEGCRFNLLEALAEAIAQTLLQQFPIAKITVNLRKPSPPVPGIFDYVEVAIVRERDI